MMGVGLTGVSRDNGVDLFVSSFCSVFERTSLACPVEKSLLLSFTKLLDISLGVIIHDHALKPTGPVSRLIHPGASLLRAESGNPTDLRNMRAPVGGTLGVRLQIRSAEETEATEISHSVASVPSCSQWRAGLSVFARA